MRFLKFLTLSLLIAIPHATSAQSDVGTRVVDETYYFSEIGFVRGSAKLRWAVRPFPTEEGTLVLCGALQIAGTQGGLTAKVPRALAFTVDGKRVVRGLQWMPIVSTRNDLDGSTAKCRAYNKAKLPEQFQYGVTVMQRRISG